MMRREGFTLLEVMLSVGLLVIISGMLFALSGTMGAAARTQGSQITTMGETRVAMLQISRELRQAAMGSITIGANGSQIQYQVPADVDGNGVPVNQNGRLELGAVRTLSRDVNDLNNDGVTLTQFVWTDGNQVRVLANNLLLDEDTDGNGTLDGGEDTNGNGVLDRGLFFERVGTGIRVTVQSDDIPDPNGVGRPIISTMRQTLQPRN